MTIEQIRITYGGESVVMSWDGTQAREPIYVDGRATQWQTADARHRTAEAVRLAARVAWPEVGDLSAWSDGTEAWDELSYVTIAEDEPHAPECSDWECVAGCPTQAARERQYAEVHEWHHR